MTLQSSTKMALGLAAAGAVAKVYSQKSTTITADHKAQLDNIGNFALYSGLALALLFHFTD